MKKVKYHIYLSTDEHVHVIKALNELRNHLIDQHKYTDAVDEVICKLLRARKKKVRII